MAKAYSRRRAIAIFAAAAGLPLVGVAGSASNATAVTWNGQALGAPATLILNHHDPVIARRLLKAVSAEVTRLECVFSLYRSDSALNELNRIGALAAPPQDLVALLDSCREFWIISGGAFDPTIQPLWTLYREHFSKPNAAPSGPSREAIRTTAKGIGFAHVKFNRDRIALTRPGMALTLNGVAQGYITDRIVELLRAAGVTNSLVDMGETRVIGAKPDGSPWHVGLAEMQDDVLPDVVVDVIDKAVATSSANGFHFDDGKRFGHLLDPRTGEAASSYRRITVVANDATSADALSTAFSLMNEAQIHSVAKRRHDLLIDLVRADGAHQRFAARA